jgi:hypothetical protein
MAAVHGSNSYVTIDGDDVSIYLDTASLNKMVETAETTAFGDDDKEFIPGLRDATLSIGGHWDATQDVFVADWDDGAVVECVVVPQGNTGGNVDYTFNAILTSYNVDMPVGGRVGWSATLQRSGATTRSTVGA